MQSRRLMFRLTALLLLATFLATTGAAAQSSSERRFAFRFGIVTGWPTVSLSEIDIEDIPSDLDVDLAAGGELAFEWYPVKKFGLELDWARIRQAKIEVNNEVVAETRLDNYTLNANWHIVRSKAVDFCLGLAGGLVRNDTVNFESGTVIASDSAGTVGLNMALDVNVGPRWAVTIGGRYLTSTIDLGKTVEECNCSEIGVDPFYFRVMGTFRF